MTQDKIIRTLQVSDNMAADLLCGHEPPVSVEFAAAIPYAKGLQTITLSHGGNVSLTYAMLLEIAEEAKKFFDPRTQPNDR